MEFLPFTRPHIDEDTIATVAQVLRSGWITTGPKNAAFEKDFCNYVLAMSKVVENPLFTTSLSLLNTARKYYADLLARRTAVPQPVTPSPVI